MRRAYVLLVCLAVLFCGAASHATVNGGFPVGGTSGPPSQAVRVALPFTTCFVDPTNSSTHANDSNNCSSSSVPILTTKRLNSFLINTFLTANTSITYMSDDTSGTGLDYSTVDTNGFNLTFFGTPQVLHTGGTVAAGTTAIAPTSNQRQTVVASDLATFAPYVWSTLGGTATVPAWIQMTSGADSGNRAWIMSGVGTASASRPVAGTYPSFSPTGTITIGDSYVIKRGSKLTLNLMTQPVGLGFAAVTGALSSVAFVEFAFTAASMGAPNATYVYSSFNGAVTGGTLYDACFLGAGISDIFTSIPLIQMTAGALVATGNDSLASPLFFTADTYVTGTSLIVGAGNYSGGFFGFKQQVNTGVQFQDMTGVGGGYVGGLIFEGSAFTGSTTDLGYLLWGSGNTGPGVLVAPGAAPTLPSTPTPKVTGTVGDFAFILPNGGATSTSARAWDDVAGAYTTTRTTSWANFAATIAGGGFAFNAHCVQCNSSLVGF